MAKTLKVSDLIEQANAFLANSSDEARLERIAVHSFVGSILHKANVYAGFNYVQPYGSVGSDSSRTFFYIHKSL